MIVYTAEAPGPMNVDVYINPLRVQFFCQEWHQHGLIKLIVTWLKGVVLITVASFAATVHTVFVFVRHGVIERVIAIILFTWRGRHMVNFVFTVGRVMHEQTWTRVLLVLYLFCCFAADRTTLFSLLQAEDISNSNSENYKNCTCSLMRN